MRLSEWDRMAVASPPTRDQLGANQAEASKRLTSHQLRHSVAQADQPTPDPARRVHQGETRMIHELIVRAKRKRGRLNELPSLTLRSYDGARCREIPGS